MLSLTIKWDRYFDVYKTSLYQTKIEKIPRGIQGKESSKVTLSSRNLVATIGAQKIPKKKRDGTRYAEGKAFLLACHTRCKCSLETTQNSVKVKLGIKIMKLAESLIG